MNSFDDRDKEPVLYGTACGSAKMRCKSCTDFKSFLSICEMNYHKLLRIFPEIATAETRELELHCATQEVIKLHLLVDERTKYTDRVVIHLTDPNAFLPQAEMCLRVYHDMKVIEVLSVQSVDIRRSSINKAPPMAMQPDERLQAITLLGEWLNHCLQFGAVSVDFVPE